MFRVRKYRHKVHELYIEDVQREWRNITPKDITFLDSKIIDDNMKHNIGN